MEPSPPLFVSNICLLIFACLRLLHILFSFQLLKRRAYLNVRVIIGVLMSQVSHDYSQALGTRIITEF